MIRFIMHLWHNYKKELKIDKARQRLNDYLAEMKTLNTKDLEKKYSNPVQVFTKLRWAVVCAKEGIIDCKKCHKFHKEEYHCGD